MKNESWRNSHFHEIFCVLVIYIWMWFNSHMNSITRFEKASFVNDQKLEWEKSTYKSNSVSHSKRINFYVFQTRYVCTATHFLLLVFIYVFLSSSLFVFKFECAYQRKAYWIAQRTRYVIKASVKCARSPSTVVYSIRLSDHKVFSHLFISLHFIDSNYCIFIYYTFLYFSLHFVAHLFIQLVSSSRVRIQLIVLDFKSMENDQTTRWMTSATKKTDQKK